MKWWWIEEVGRRDRGRRLLEGFESRGRGGNEGAGERELKGRSESV